MAGLLEAAARRVLGACPDGTLACWINNERVYGGSFETRGEMKAAAFEHIEVFNNRKRLYSTPGYKSPQDLDDWFTAQQLKKLVA